jgi:hypothetical protein
MTFFGGGEYDDEDAQDAVGQIIQAATGSNVSVTYDDGGDEITVDTSALNEEEVEDAVAALVSENSNLTVNYDDNNDVLNIGLSDSINIQSATIDGQRTQVTSDTQGEDNLTTVWSFPTSPSDGSKYYPWMIELDARGLSAGDLDQTALYVGATTDNVDTWAMNPVIDIESGFSGLNAYAVETDVNTNEDGFGVGHLISGVGLADAASGVAIERADSSEWIVGQYVKNVRDAYYRAVADDGTTDWEIDSFGNMNMAGGDIYNIGLLYGLPVLSSAPAAGDLVVGDIRFGDSTGPNSRDEIFWSVDGSTVARVEADSIIQ